MFVADKIFNIFFPVGIFVKENFCNYLPSVTKKKLNIKGFMEIYFLCASYLKKIANLNTGTCKTTDIGYCVFSVFEELQLITKQHYIALEKLVQEQGLPALQQQERQAQARTTSRTRTSSYTQPTQQYPAVSQYRYAPAMY